MFRLSKISLRIFWKHHTPVCVGWQVVPHYHERLQKRRSSKAHPYAPRIFSREAPRDLGQFSEFIYKPLLPLPNPYIKWIIACIAQQPSQGVGEPSIIPCGVPVWLRSKVLDSDAFTEKFYEDPPTYPKYGSLTRLRRPNTCWKLNLWKMGNRWNDSGWTLNCLSHSHTTIEGKGACI